MSPPQLSGNAPVTDVIRPVVINLLKAFGDKLDFAIFYGLNGRLNKLVHFDKPLLLYHRLDYRAASVMISDGMLMLFDACQKSQFF